MPLSSHKRVRHRATTNDAAQNAHHFRHLPPHVQIQHEAGRHGEREGGGGDVVVRPLRHEPRRAVVEARLQRPVRVLPPGDARGRAPPPRRGRRHRRPGARGSLAAAGRPRGARGRPGGLPRRDRQEEARAPGRRQLQGHSARAQGHGERRQGDAAPPLRQVWVPRRLHPGAHRGREGLEQGADEGEPAAGDAVARGRLRQRRLPGVPLLRARRAEAGHERRRGGRVQRGAVPGGLRAERQDPGRRDQRDDRPAARPGREAPRHRRHLPQRHHPRPSLPLPPIQDGVLAVGESQPTWWDAEEPQRRPGNLHQRLQRRPEVRRRQRVFGGVVLDRRHDGQLHQSGGGGAGDDVRAAAERDEGEDPRRAGEPPPPRKARLLRPLDDPVQQLAGASALLFRDV